MKRMQAGKSAGPDVVIMPAKRSSIEVLSHVSQVALAVVAIFGYFYTVRPIYQKDRLEEQVASYQQQITTYEQQIEEHQPSVRALEAQLASLESSRANLLGEIGNMNSNLKVVRAERDAIKEQIQFMAYRYRTPDGRPATTPEEVRQVQENDLRRSFVSAVRTGCWSYSAERQPFSSSRYIDEKDRTAAFPFTQQELDVWVERGAALPLYIALTCIRSQSNRHIARQGNASQPNPTLVEMRDAAIERAQAAARVPWSPPMDPVATAKSIEPRRQAIQKIKEEELKKVEDEYGDWKSVVGASRRAIFKHNYEVGLQNAKTRAAGEEISLTFGAQTKANAFRESLNKEIDRLINAAWE